MSIVGIPKRSGVGGGKTSVVRAKVTSFIESVRRGGNLNSPMIVIAFVVDFLPFYVDVARMFHVERTAEMKSSPTESVVDVLVSGFAQL